MSLTSMTGCRRAAAPGPWAPLPLDERAAEAPAQGGARGAGRRARGQDDRLAGLRPAEDDRRAVARQAGDDALTHLLAAPQHGHAPARDGAGRDVDPFGLLDHHFGGGAHAWLQPGFHLVELEGDVVADHAAVAR